jgi:excisionase family DNA binding protein
MVTEDESTTDSGPVRISVVAKALGVSSSYVRKLANEGRIPSVKTDGGHRRFNLDEVRAAWPTGDSRPGTEGRPAADRVPAEQIVFTRTYDLDGLEEHGVWLEVEGAIDGLVNDTTRSTLRYITTEMVNNAIDHSDGTTVAVTAAQTADGDVRITIADDGIGVFERLRRGLDLDSDTDALGELTKGKRTTMPERHTGEGIFFSSKAADLFSLEANGLTLAFDNDRDDFAAGVSQVNEGTTATVTINPQSTRGLGEVFARFTDEDQRFARSLPRVKLFETGATFISRSEAKRLALGLENFDEVELDFTGVTEVGQGFADELLRVWASQHPTTTLIPINMNDPVAFMIARSRQT